MMLGSEFMDFSSFFSVVQTIIVLIGVIILANLSLKYLNKFMLKQNRIIKIVEKTPIFNNSALGVVQVCGIYYLMSFTDKDNRILKELDKSQVELFIEETKSQQTNLQFGMRKKS